MSFTVTDLIGLFIATALLYIGLEYWIAINLSGGNDDE